MADAEACESYKDPDTLLKPGYGEGSSRPESDLWNSVPRTKQIYSRRKTGAVEALESHHHLVQRFLTALALENIRKIVPALCEALYPACRMKI